MRISDWSSDVCSSDLSPGLAGRAERGKRADLGEHKRGPPSATPEKKQIKQPQPNCMFGRIKGSTWATYRLQSCGCSAEWRSRLPFSCQPAIAARQARATQPTSRNRSLPQSRSEEHTSELQSLMRISYAVFCLKKKKTHNTLYQTDTI